MKRILALACTLFICSFIFVACCCCNEGYYESHVCSFGEWETIQEPTCVKEGYRERSCECGSMQQEKIAALGHTEVVDAAVEPTCTATGLTEGKHCSVCGSILVAPSIVEKLSHDYAKETITKEATCLSKGTKALECIYCSDEITQEYELDKRTATEIHAEALNYIGEIIVYDQNGKELGLATGFVYSDDGKIITNYHVIEGAYSAKITINNKTYQISKVLAYDRRIDLAVLQVNETFSTYAKICKNEIAVGSTVYAIGSSRGMTNTFSQGIVTYYDRVVDGVSHIQHDASITNGNSGGPLINEYGEVVGINTWQITDSQNLNFAVFVKELDNLSFDNSMTMAQFYDRESNKFDKMVNYIRKNGRYNSYEGYYVLVLGKTYSSDHSSTYTRYAYYNPADHTITLELAINIDKYVSFTIDGELDGAYEWSYVDDNNYKMSGVIVASTYDSNTLLGYNSNNIRSAETRATVRKSASEMVSLLCSHLTSDFSSIGVTASDLCFYNY